MNNWKFALALSLPVFAFFLGYLFNHPASLIPTGFIQPDNVSYIAYAKQYLDAGNIHIFYSNPFDINSTPIYFQPQTLFFAFLLMLGVPAGMILIPFTIICSVVCFRLIIAIYDLVATDNKYRTLHIWLLSWGGGLLVAGSIATTAARSGLPHAFDDMFFLDPAQGWWGLNFGRAILFSCEAYYHALFLGCIYTILKKKWMGAAILLFIMSVSHPFTGIELAGIVLTWCLTEWIIDRKKIPMWFTPVVVAIVGFHLYYYLYFLNQFEDHRSVSGQYSLNWRLRFFHMLPAYALVGALAIASLYMRIIRTFFSVASSRLFACWFLVAFLLANHELFTEARQPIHFTRGYIWTSLFLLGIPALQKLSSYLKSRAGVAGLSILAIVFFLDNFSWIGSSILSQPRGTSPVYINEEQHEVLTILDKESDNKTTIVSNDEALSLLSTVYSKSYPWYSHPFTTPFAKTKKAEQDQFFRAGNIDSNLARSGVIFVLKKTDTVALKALNPVSKEKIIKTSDHIIIKSLPR